MGAYTTLAVSEFLHVSAYSSSFYRMGQNPVNCGFILVITTIVSAVLSATLRGGVGADERSMPAVWRFSFRDGSWKRYLVALAAGFILLYGTR